MMFGLVGMGEIAHIEKWIREERSVNGQKSKENDHLKEIYLWKKIQRDKPELLE